MGNSLSLFAIVLIAAPGVISGIKLTPVEPQSQRIDLSAEARYLSATLHAAKDMVDLEVIRSVESAADVLASEPMKRLVGAVSRWLEIEAKAKGSVTANDQAKLLESINYKVATGRALIGHLYALSAQDTMAVRELEFSCSPMWDHEIAFKIIDADVSSSYVKLFPCD